MVIDKKIQRYVGDVVAFLPQHRRSWAERELTEMITDLVRDHAAGREPDILDARAVLEELGDPEVMALSWMEVDDIDERERSSSAVGAVRSAAGRGSGRPAITASLNRLVSAMLLVFTVLSFVLTGVGIVALSTHAINTMLPVFLGCVLALASLAGRTLMTSRRERTLTLPY